MKEEEDKIQLIAVAIILPKSKATYFLIQNAQFTDALVREGRIL